MAALEFRQPTASELGEFLRVSIQSYGSDGTDAEVADEALSNEIDRSYGVWDDGRCVAGAGAFSFALTMPGGAIVRAAGVTMVGVAPTHRRRGILTGMLRLLHDDARHRDEPVALLTASESSIYRRFGYGLATDVAHLSIRADAVRFDPPVAGPGSFELVDLHTDTSALMAVHDRVRRTRVGWLSLSPGMWEQIRADPESDRNGRTPRRAVVHRDAGGRPDGYAMWRVTQHYGSDRLAANTLYLDHLTGVTPDVEAALWDFVASIDLVTTVVWETGPPDPDIRWRLVEPRQLRTMAVADMVWARLLDIPAALAARTYGAAGTLHLEVTDRFHPELGGRFRLSSSGRGGAARCERMEPDTRESAVDAAASGSAAICLDTSDLASVTIGGVAPSQLAASGRITGTQEAIDLADALFALPRRPWWPIEF